VGLVTSILPCNVACNQTLVEKSRMSAFELVTNLRRLSDTILSRHRPADDTRWHKWETFFPVRLSDGQLSCLRGQIWRRVNNGRAEYQQDAETLEEWSDRV
jgi:hypothetical protein